MRAGGGGVVAAVTKMNVLPFFFSRAEQRPFKIPVHAPAPLSLHHASTASLLVSLVFIIHFYYALSSVLSPLSLLVQSA